MIIYTLDANFEREAIIDEYESCIWTERYIEAGDVKLTLPATREYYNLLAPNTLIMINDSSEPMLLETQEIENGMMTVSGKNVETFFNQRYIEGPYGLGHNGSVGEVIHSILYNMNQTLAPIGYNPDRLLISSIDFDYPSDPVGESTFEDVPNGPVYDGILRIARVYNIGMKVVVVPREPLSSVPYPEPFRYLRFIPYVGHDLTDTVKFSPDLDNFANIKELRSTADHKTVVPAWPPSGIDWVDHINDSERVASLDETFGDSDSPPFESRYLEISCDDITEDMLGPHDIDGNVMGTEFEKRVILRRMLRTRAWEGLYKHKRTKIVDGEVPPEALLKYKTDYRLGDLVSIEGDFAPPVTGRVLEYIRSSDATGERAYPSIVPLSSDEVIAP